MNTQIELFNDPVLDVTVCINGLTNLNMTNHTSFTLMYG